jgi:hypothetical protein
MAEDFRRETVPGVIYRCLSTLCVCLSGDLATKRRAVQFLQADGLPPVVRHLMGTAVSDPASDISRQISVEAAKALCKLLDASVVFTQVAGTIVD